MSNDVWAFVVFYLTLMGEVAPQRGYPLREVLNSLWRMTPNDLPLWHAVYAQTPRRLTAGVFETVVHDLRALLRLSGGHVEQPSAAILIGGPYTPVPKAARGRAMIEPSTDASYRRLPTQQD